MKKILLVGQSGAGKSTIANILYHGSVEYQRLYSPSLVSRQANGCTTSFHQLITDSFDHIFDTPGFSDYEDENPTILLHKLRKFLLAVDIQCSHVCFVIPYGRLTTATIKSWAILQTLFGKKYLKKKIIILLTHCDDTNEMTIENFFQENQHLMKKNKIIAKLYQIYTKTPSHIITCSLQADGNSIRDRTFFLPKRLQFFVKIQSLFSSSSSSVEEFQLTPVRRTVQEFLTMFLESLSELMTFSGVVGGGKKAVTMPGMGDIVYSELERQWNFLRLSDVEMKYHFPDCSFCLSNIYGNDEAMKPCSPRQCGHIFHHQCLTDWFMKSPDCPTCRQEIDNNDNKILDLPYQQSVKEMEGTEEEEQESLIMKGGAEDVEGK